MNRQTAYSANVAQRRGILAGPHPQGKSIPEPYFPAGHAKVASLFSEKSKKNYGTKFMTKTIKSKPAGRPENKNSIRVTARSLTEKLGFQVTPKMIREWSDKGYPIDNPEKLLDCLRAQQRPGALEPKTITDAKLAKLLVDIEGAKFRLDVARGNYTHNDLIREQGARIGHATRSELQRIKADAPTWEGLPAAEIERRISKLINSICANLGDALSKVYRSPKGAE